MVKYLCLRVLYWYCIIGLQTTVHSRILPEHNPLLSQTESETETEAETEAATVEQSNVDIITPSETLIATQFPFVLDMIELKRTNDDDEGSEELSHLKITVRNGTLAEMETYPGLWVQAPSSASTSSASTSSASTSSSSRTEATITGIESDIQSYLRDKMVAVNPIERNWVGIASIRFTLVDFQNAVSSSIWYVL